MRVIVRSVIILAATLVSVISVPAAFASSSGAGGESAQSCPSLAVPRITAELNERLLSSLPGNVHPLAKPEYDRGRVSDSLPMEHMILILQRTSDQEKALNARIEQLHDARVPLLPPVAYRREHRRLLRSGGLGHHKTYAVAAAARLSD